MRDQQITIAGRLASDVELRFTPSGAAVASLTVAYTPSRYDKNSGQWQDGTTQWWRCSAWNQGKLTLAENVANVLKKGDAVIIHGILEAREYEKDGQKRTVTEVRVQHIGKDALYHGQPYAQAPSQPVAQPSYDDPWASQAQGNGNAELPPF